MSSPDPQRPRAFARVGSDKTPLPGTGHSWPYPRTPTAEEASAQSAARSATAGERAANAAEEANTLAAPKIEPRWGLEWTNGGRMRFTNHTGETTEDIKISAPQGGVSFGNPSNARNAPGSSTARASKAS